MRQQFLHRRNSGQVEPLLVHCLKQPPQSSNDQHEPVIAAEHSSWLATVIPQDSSPKADPDEIIDAIRMLRFRGHDVILFHILDEAEFTFPFSGSVDLPEPESEDHNIVDAAGIRP